VKPLRGVVHGCTAIALAFCLLGAGAASARRGNDDYRRLSDQFDHLAADPVLGQRAPAQMDRARAALESLKNAGRSGREEQVYLTERRIAIARASAEAEVLEDQRNDLQRENDRMQLALARRDAAQARAELERQRLQSQIRTEEAERARQDAETARAEGEQATQAADAARAEADQAKRMADAQAQATALAKKEAALEAAVAGGAAAAPARERNPNAANGARTLALADRVFIDGTSSFAGGASKQITKAAAFVSADASRRVRIEVSAANRALAQQRANAMRQALIAAGIDAKRITTTANAAKRGRVEIVLQGGRG
jgi:outer membrane protein OmpA-like peptidoglycan-associated protein